MEMGDKVSDDKSVTGTQEKVGVRDDGNWGTCDILKKAFEFYQLHACLFSLIQITIVLPCTVLWLLNQHFIKILIHNYLPFPPGPPCEDPCPASPPSDGPTPDEWKCVVAFVILLFLGFVFWVNVVGSLYYSVGSIYAGKTISFRDVVKQLPCLWKGLFITGLFGGIFFIIVAVAVFLLGSLLLTFSSSVSFLPPAVAYFLTFTFGVILFFYAWSSTQMANGVTVFEERSGLPTFCKALQLLKSKWCVALGLAVTFFIPQVILAVIINAATWAWAGNCAKWVFVGIFGYLLAVVLELNVISSALFYLSAKQSKQETISVNHMSFSQFESGYQRIATPEQVV